MEHPLARLLGRLSGDLLDSYAWLNSPAAIAGEIARLESVVRGGEATSDTHVQLQDWRAIRAAQRALLAAQGEGDE